MLMSHPGVAEAVAFGCPDEMYGEIVAAAVVPSKPVSDTAAFAKDIQKQSGRGMAAFEVSIASDHIAFHDFESCGNAITGATIFQQQHMMIRARRSSLVRRCLPSR